MIQFQKLIGSDAEEPDEHATKFWGELIVFNDEYTKFPRLVGAIYDFLRSSTSEPAPIMANREAYSYLSPSMMTAAAELFDWDHFRFSDKDKDLIDQNVLDSLLKSYYTLQKIDFNTFTRPGGPENGLPLIKRGAFSLLVGKYILADPHTMCRKINAILAREDIVLVDPYEEEPFQFRVIPRSAFPAAPYPNFTQVVNDFRLKWLSATLEILQQARASASTTPDLGLRRSKVDSELVQMLRMRQSQRSDAEIMAQLQTFSPVPGESAAASKARLDRIFEGVDEATMDRLMVQAAELKRHSEMNVASSFLNSQRMQAEAQASAFWAQDRGNGVSSYRWEWKRD